MQNIFFRKTSFRLILPVICTLTITACQTFEDIDRGLYDVTSKVTTRDLVTGKRELSTADRRNQIIEGNQAAQKIIDGYYQKGAKLNEDLSQIQYQRALGIFNRVHSVSHLRNEKWTLVLLPDREFNAFVTGGTVLFVNKGLMDNLSFDDEIAAVMAHEIAHVSSNHVFERKGSTIASMLGGSKSAKTSAVQAGYSTNDEAEADKVGILYVALAGFDPFSASRIWKKIYNQQGNYGQMYQTHPISSTRMKTAEITAQQVKQYQIPGQINPDFASILSGNSLYQTQQENDFVGPLLGDDPQPASSTIGTSQTANSALQPGKGAGLLAAFQTASTYYEKKEEAKTQAVNQATRIATLQEIQSKMQIMGAKKLDDKTFAMQIQYNGVKPVENLAIIAVTESNKSLFRPGKTIAPQETFTANFDSVILEPVNGFRPKMKLVVDEGSYSE